MQTAVATIMALDIGERRIGVALASFQARLANPFTTLEASTALTEIAGLIEQHHVVAIVAGLPRGLSGQTTKQTESTRSFINQLKDFGVSVYEQDEAVTSRQAEAELRSRKQPFSKGDIDSLAATYILEDFLHDNPELAND